MLDLFQDMIQANLIPKEKNVDLLLLHTKFKKNENATVHFSVEIEYVYIYINQHTNQ